MISLLSLALSLFMLILFVRAILSWFPNRGGVLGSINDMTVAITEPVLAPIRRRIPPMGGFDVSFLVVFLAILVLRSVLRI